MRVPVCARARSCTRVCPHARTSTLHVLTHMRAYNLEWACQALPCVWPRGTGQGPQRKQACQAGQGPQPRGSGQPCAAGGQQGPRVSTVTGASRTPPGPPALLCSPGTLAGKEKLRHGTFFFCKKASQKSSPALRTRQAPHSTPQASPPQSVVTTALRSARVRFSPFSGGREAGTGPSPATGSASQRKTSGVHRLRGLRSCHAAPGFDSHCQGLSPPTPHGLFPSMGTLTLPAKAVNG